MPAPAASTSSRASLQRRDLLPAGEQSGVAEYGQPTIVGTYSPVDEQQQRLGRPADRHGALGVAVSPGEAAAVEDHEPLARVRRGARGQDIVGSVQVDRLAGGKLGEPLARTAAVGDDRQELIHSVGRYDRVDLRPDAERLLRVDAVDRGLVQHSACPPAAAVVITPRPDWGVWPGVA